MIGKTILFVSLAIGKAMFPISSENFEKGEKTKGLFRKSILIVSLISFIALIFCFFVPEFVIWLVSIGSNQYLEASNILFIIALAYTFISFSNVIIIYNLSINNMKKSSWTLLFFVVLQIVLLSLFNSSLMEFSLALLTVSMLMLIYTVFITRKN